MNTLHHGAKTNAGRIAVVLLVVLTASGCRNQAPHDEATPSEATTTVATAKPEAAETALQRLKDGNARFVDGRSIHPHDDRRWRTALQSAQHPFAVVIGCSDSRVPPELVFDQGFGDLFVIRVAGNVVDNDVSGSVEYAIDHLDTKLVVVMGHTNCGAVTAAIDHAHGSLPHEPQEILLLIGHIEPAIDGDEERSREELIDQSVRRNVEQSVQQIVAVEDVSKAIQDRGVAVVGAIYDMHSGQVEFLNQEDKQK